MEQIKNSDIYSNSFIVESQNNTVKVATNSSTETVQGNLETLNKSLYTRTINNNILLQLEGWFDDQAIELASQLIQQLQNNIPKQKSSLSCIQAFLQLHKLAKPEYKQFFTETWEKNTHKFILYPHFELISPLKLNKNNNNIVGLSNKIYDLLKNENTNTNAKDNLLTTLIMLIEKHIIERGNYQPNTYLFQMSDLPIQDLPKEGEWLWDYDSYYDEFDPETGCIIPPTWTKISCVQIKLQQPEVGELTQNSSNYKFTRAKDFTGNSIKINYMTYGSVYMYSKQTIICKLNTLKPQCAYSNLFSNGGLFYILLNKDYKLALNYLLNSEYFTPDLNYGFQSLKRTNINSLLPVDYIKLDSTVLAYTLYLEKYEYVEKLLAKGAKVHEYMLSDLIDKTNRIQLLVSEERPKLTSVLLLLKHADKYVASRISAEICKFCIRDDNKFIRISLLDYVLNYLPQEQRLQAISLILPLISDYSLYILTDLLSILQQECLRYYIENYDLISSKFIVSYLKKFAMCKKKDDKSSINFLLKDQNLNLFFTILRKKLETIVLEIEDIIDLKDNNLHLMQLFFAGINSKNINLSAKVKEVYEIYLSSESIQKLLQNPEFIVLFGDLEQKPLWEEGSNKDAANYIFIAGNLVMLLTVNSLEKFLDETNKYSFINWKEFFLFNRQGDNLPNNQYSLTTLFIDVFSIFLRNFSNYIQKQQVFSRFIKSLFLGQYEEVLIKALTSKVANKLFLQIPDGSEINNDLPLVNLLNKHIVRGSNQDINGITAENLSNIKKIFNLEKHDDDKLAQCIVCIACVFVKYSSNKIFGSEYNSPLSLRLYAHALLKEAYALDENSFSKNGAVSSIKSYTNWQNRLTGKDFSCASVLSNIMLKHIKENYDIDIVSKVIPIKFL